MKYLFFAGQAYSISILRPLQAAIEKRGDTVAWYLNHIPHSLLNENEVLLETIDAAKKYNADAVFAPGNKVPDFFPGIKVCIFHGFGIDKKGHFRIRGFFDLYCTHGPATTKPFMRLAEKYKYFSVVETGWSKMDPLFSYTKENTHAESNASKVILYAPTFSPSLTSAAALIEPIKTIVKTRKYKWIVKFHPKTDISIIEQYKKIESNMLTISDDADIIPLLHQADIMVSDTSSVISEFLLLDKPVITLNTRTPGPHLINISDPKKLNQALDIATKGEEKLLTAARDFIDQMHPYRDGQSSERILDATENFISNNMSKKKPLNLWRKFQTRKNMKYYHLK